MLSEENDIRTTRLLCKRLTGRTSASPLGAINRYLRSHNDHYVIELVKSVKKTQFSPSYLTFEIKALQSATGRPQSGQQQRNLNLPCSLKQLVLLLTGLDAQAERDFQLGYGAQRTA